MYSSWYIERDRHNFLSFWAIFCPFTPLATQKIKILKWKKKAWRCHHFTRVYQKLWLYTILFPRHGAWRMKFLFFILGYFLPFYPPNSPKNQNYKEMKTTPRDIIILHMRTKNYDHMMYGSWDMARDDGRTDGRTDGRKKVTYRGGCPPKKIICSLLSIIISYR